MRPQGTIYPHSHNSSESQRGSEKASEACCDVPSGMASRSVGGLHPGGEIGAALGQCVTACREKSHCSLPASSASREAGHLRPENSGDPLPPSCYILVCFRFAHSSKATSKLSAENRFGNEQAAVSPRRSDISSAPVLRKRSFTQRSNNFGRRPMTIALIYGKVWDT